MYATACVLHFCGYAPTVGDGRMLYFNRCLYCFRPLRDVTRTVRTIVDRAHMCPCCLVVAGCLFAAHQLYVVGDAMCAYVLSSAENRLPHIVIAHRAQ